LGSIDRSTAGNEHSFIRDQDLRAAHRRPHREGRLTLLPSSRTLKVWNQYVLTERRVMGIKELQRYLVDKVLEIYRSQSVAINDKHIETI
jgi:hypothetical protein